MKKIIPVIIILVLLSGVGAFAFSRSNTQQPGANTPMEAMDMGTQSPAQNTTQEEQSSHETNMVEIRNFAFSPAKIRIKKGTTVTWTNRDGAGHDITPTAGANDFQASKLLANGESYSFTFNNAGTYSYICSPHPYMKGTVEVVE